MPWVLKSFRGGHRTPDVETQQNRHGHMHIHTHAHTRNEIQENSYTDDCFGPFLYNTIEKGSNTEPQGMKLRFFDTNR